MDFGDVFLRRYYTAFNYGEKTIDFSAESTNWYSSHNYELDGLIISSMVVLD